MVASAAVFIAPGPDVGSRPAAAAAARSYVCTAVATISPLEFFALIDSVPLSPSALVGVYAPSPDPDHDADPVAVVVTAV